MKKISSSIIPASTWSKCLLGIGLAAGPLAAAAQTPADSIFALGNVTANVQNYQAGSQIISVLLPANLGTNAVFKAATGRTITGVTPGQVIVGIDVRPSTGGLYALGYNNSAMTAQLYTLTNGAGNTKVAMAVGGAISLDLEDTNRANTKGLIPNVGFDFNPRLDRIRVVAPNGTNYRLNPNTGGLAATDGMLAYNSASNVGHPPYVGTAAYTNSALTVSGTTLYDIDVSSGGAILSTQNLPNAGTLNPLANVTFQVNNSGTYFPYGAPTAGLGLDIYYDRSSGKNIGYLIEARYSATNNTDPTQGFASNLYVLDLTTGKATGQNLAGKIPIYFSDIAAYSPAPLTWNGQVSTFWNNLNNWTPNRVPRPNDDVFIPGKGGTVQFEPIVSDTEQALSVTLGNGAVLTVMGNGLLNVYGDFTNNDGTVVGADNGTIALVGTTQQEITGNTNTNFRNLTIGSASSNAGAFISTPVSVQNALTVFSTFNVPSDQTLTLLSNSTTGTAYVVNSGGVVTGAATVQRYIDPSINGSVGYRHYSAPVTNTTVNDLTTASFSPVFNTVYNTSTTPGTTTPFPTVFGYNQAQYESSVASSATPDFDKGYYSPASGTSWVSGTGYTVNINSSEIEDFVGTLATGNISTSGQGRSGKANAGWQLLGNPYPSPLDWDQVASSGLSGIDNAVYVFKSTGQYAGNYTSYVNSQGTNGGSNLIALAQGFFVRTSSGSSSGSLNFTNAQRTTTNTALFQRTTADVRPQLLLELGNGTTATQTDIYFEQGATPAFDKAYDAATLPFLNGLTLASESGTDLLSINGQPALAGTVTVPLRVAVATAGTYTLSAADLANLPAGYHAYLRDATLNTYTDLATTASVSVSLAAGTGTGRFAIVFGTNAPLATAPAALAAMVTLYPNPAHGTAMLLLPATLRGQSASQVEIFNTLGQSVLRRTVAAGGSDQVELPLSSLASGIYTVRATTATGAVAKQLRVE